MKVFSDTSVWIDFLRGGETAKTKHLLELIESGQPVYSLPVIIQEILQGFKHEKDATSHLEKLEALNFLPFEFEDAVEAARLYRHLRKSGITPTTIDIQIVAVCLRHGFHLLTEDKDFEVISKKLGLALV